MSLKQQLQKNKLTVGSWITIGHPSVAEIMASAGFDWLTLDMEHSAIGLSEAQTLIMTIQGKGIAALVRVAKNDDVLIKRVMDAGADGVIVPMVNSREDAERAVSFVKYPPEGKRGVGLARAQAYGTGFDAYKKWLAKESVVIAQIEHIDGVKNVDKILTTPGIDGIIIGPYDLSGSMGVPGEFERPEVIAAIGKVEAACKKHKKPLGFHVIPPDAAKMKEKIAAGYSFIGFSLDFLFLGDKVRGEMKQVKSKKA